MMMHASKAAALRAPSRACFSSVASPRAISCFVNKLAPYAANIPDSQRISTAMHATHSKEHVRVVEAQPFVPVPDRAQQASFSAVVIYQFFLFSVMIAAAGSQDIAEPVRRFMRSFWVFVPLGLVYGVLLAQSWTPDTLAVMMPGSLESGFSEGFNPQFFPKLDSITILFTRSATAMSAIVHLAAINLFLGRTIFLDGIERGIPTWHSLMMAVGFGPLGYLCHTATKFMCAVRSVVNRPNPAMQ